MARKKRAWNSSNPLWRYLHGKRKTKAARKRGSGNMARKRKGGSSRGIGGISSRGFLPVGGIVASALLGLGTAAVAKRFIGAPLGSFTGAAAGFAVGGVGGALGGWVHDNIGNVGGASTSGSNTGAP